VRSTRSPIRTSLAIGTVLCGALALIALDDVAATITSSNLSVRLQSDSEVSVEKNSRALRDVEAGAYGGLHNLSKVLTISGAQTRALTSEGIDISEAKRTAAEIIEFTNAINLAGFDSFNAYETALKAPGGEILRNPAVDLAHSRIASLNASDLHNFDLALRHLFRTQGNRPLEVASFSH
jgi:hypothetical protein